MDDSQLIQAYVAGSEAAFESLVRRHLGMVHALAHRELRDPTLARDVSQAVFILLARKAPRLSPRVVVSGWLYRTTRLVAANVRRKKQQRRRREQEAVARQSSESENGAWAQVAPFLDQALGSLGEIDRNAILLRFVEGRSHKEVGIVLGLREEAAKKRLQRALDRLRKILTAQGAPVSALALAPLLQERLSAAPPAGLDADVLASVFGSNSDPFTAAPLADEPAREVLRSPTAGGLRLAAVLALLLSIVWVVWRPAGPVSQLAQPRSSMQPANTPNPPSPIPPAAVSGDSSTFRLTVVSGKDGSPLAGANVPVNWVVDGTWNSRDDVVTDDQGVAEIPLPRDVQRLDAAAHVSGWEHRSVTWMRDWPMPLPAAYTLRLNRAETLGGVVLDAQRRPVAGVDVWIQYGISDTSTREPLEDQERIGAMRRLRIGTTDAQGRWTAAFVSNDRHRFDFEFDHPNYAQGLIRVNELEGNGTPREQLRTREAEVILQSGLTVMGRVQGPEGQPIAEARITRSWHEPGVLSGPDGSFEFTRLTRGSHSLFLLADGFVQQVIRAEAGGPPVTLRLESGGVIRAKVTTEDGDPLPRAMVGLDETRETEMLGWQGWTDSAGEVVWEGAPTNRVLRFHIFAKGYARRRGIRLQADGKEQIIPLSPAFSVSGRVTDARTGQPVTRFKAIPGTDRSSVDYGTDGLYSLRWTEEGVPSVTIEADGYETALGTPEVISPGMARCDFQLAPLEVSGPITGWVRQPDGSAAVGVEVTLATLDRAVVVHPTGRLSAHRGTVAITDETGHFELPRDSRAHTVVASGVAGHSQMRVRSFREPVTVVLQPWGRISGRVRSSPTEIPVWIVDRGYSEYLSGVSMNWKVMSSEDGAFEFPAVPPGHWMVRAGRPEAESIVHGAAVTVRPGASVEVELGHGYRRVTGRLMTRSIQGASTGLGTGKHARLVTQVRSVRLDVETASLEEWHQQAEAYLSSTESGWGPIPRMVRLDLKSDGSFSAEQVPPGPYSLLVEAGGSEHSTTPSDSSPGRLRWDLFQADVLVPPIAGEDSETDWDLGVVEVQRLHPGGRLRNP